ncbi:glycosyltransferase [Pedobacter frigidisoli]|uniref:Glycosyltransferase n=1 Tax=Pedobacter frigidisoli TaxID=2530455 RepID=A0A4R0NZ38_9SPHI|nr:glycosyltransferase [Pedobacter frigidisoli]TCD07720.1 glycosyltransferase [Pedobacter frigidisoli]
MFTSRTELTVRIFVVTYRRHKLLIRALDSLIEQVHKNWFAEVLNDDPFDREVADIINSFGDSRISLSKPSVKRGANGNFNYAFGHKVNEDFASILEDDNWWEPDFLSVMIDELGKHPTVQVAVSNEKVWLEECNGDWTDTNRTIWTETTSTKLYYYHFAEKCGSAKICNSAMLWRTKSSKKWIVPDDLPVDVSEHFRERLMPHPILLINEPLVNFSQTLETVRSNSSCLWGSYQVLLIASIFSLINKAQRVALAHALWTSARNGNNPFKTTLLHTAVASGHSRELFRNAKVSELLRYVMTWIKNPVSCYKTVNALKNKEKHFSFLTSQNVVKNYIDI